MKTLPIPGDLYVLETKKDVGIEWLVVRYNVDDPGRILLCPLDDFPFVGSPDVNLTLHGVDRPLIARCGQTMWVDSANIENKPSVGAIPISALNTVRTAIAGLARGNPPNSAPDVDSDPEYEDWMDEVAAACCEHEREITLELE